MPGALRDDADSRTAWLLLCWIAVWGFRGQPQPFYGKRRCEVLAGSLPAEQPILPLEQVQGMTVGDRPGTHRLRDTSKEYHKGYKQQYHKMLSSFYPNDYG
jgi:hypothetical protein